MTAITYADACLDPELFGDWFSADSWATWRVVDKTLFGLPLSPNELETFTALTGRAVAPTTPCSEAWLAFGRRSGKDVKAASLVSYLATIGAELYGFRKHLTKGERGVVQLLAVDKAQAAVCFGYVSEIFDKPLLASMVKRKTADTIGLTNGLAIEIMTNDQRRIRGRTCVALVLDEVAHWLGEASANPDEAVYQAALPAMATIPQAMLFGISSTHMRSGLLWRKYSEHWGQDGDVLVAKAPTWVMNPNLPREHRSIAAAYSKDPAWAAAEYGSEWRSDLAAFLSRDAVNASIDTGVRERPPVETTRYFGFCDPSGGSNDAMTLGISHIEDDKVVLDALREVCPPFDPASVVAEFCGALRAYQLSTIEGDKYAAQWVVSAFAKHNVTYRHAYKSKSDLYVELLGPLNAGRVRLLDHDKLTAQLINLERRTVRGSGRDTIDHPKGAHDDVANAAAGAIYLADAAERFTTAVGCAPKLFHITGGQYAGPRDEPMSEAELRAHPNYVPGYGVIA